MTEDEIFALIRALPGAVATTAHEGDGSPEIAWGDSFFFVDPDGDPANRRMPFATIVVKDYPGYDTASDLDRPGVFRLNVAVGRAAFERLLGYPPGDLDVRAPEIELTALDTLLPHPTYAPQGWVSVLNPGPATADLVRRLLVDAHRLASARHDRRRGHGEPD